MQKLIITLLIFTLILPNCSLALENIPENPDELKDFGKKFLEFFPTAFKEVWKEAVKIWQKMWEWFKDIWDKYILGWIKDVWQNIWKFFKNSIVERFNKIIR